MVRRRGSGSNSEVIVNTNPLRLAVQKFPPGGTSRSSPRGELHKDQYKGKIRSDEDQDGIGDHARESGSGSPSARLSNRERVLIRERTGGLDYGGRIVGRCECGGLTRAHGAGAVLCDACRRVYTDGQTSQNGTLADRTTKALHAIAIRLSNLALQWGLGSGRARRRDARR